MLLKDKGILKALWAGMFILCCPLGFLQISDTATQIFLSILALLFFVPAAADLWFSFQRRDKSEIRLIRNISILSLSLTTVLMIANILSVLSRSLALGNVLYYILVVVSTPMVCSYFEMGSLLAWAILLWSSIAALRKLK